MKVLLTGGTGQVGRALLATASAGLDIAAPPREKLDLADEGSIRAAFEACSPDLVVNCGAYTAVDKAESEIQLARSINAEAVGTLSECCQEAGARLVQLSTDFVFDGAQGRAYRPLDRRGPLNTYGRTKAEGEDAAGEDALIVRTSWVYDAHGANFVSAMLSRMRRGAALRVVADQIAAPSLAGGVARTVWALAERGCTGIWHHRDAGVASWYDFAVAIGEEALSAGLIDKPAQVAPIASADYPAPAPRPHFSLLEDSATRAALEDEPRYWRDNLRRVIAEVAQDG